MLALAFLVVAPVEASSAALLPVDPVALFKTACVVGTVKLDRRTTSMMTSRNLSPAARNLISLSDRYPPPEEVKPSALPNPIYKLAGKNPIYLIVGDPDDRSHARFANTCAVIWQSRTYAAARDSVLAGLHGGPIANGGKAPGGGSFMLDPRTNELGLGYVGRNDGAFNVKAVAYSGWVALTKAPSSSTDTSPSALPTGDQKQ